MKTSLSLLALASSALALNIPRGGGGGGGGYGGGGHGGGGGWYTTEIKEVYTTVCPVTETITKGGKTETKIYTSTDVITKLVPTTIYTTVQEYTTAWEVTSVYQTVRSLWS